jgi:hypothetical protein
MQGKKKNGCYPVTYNLCLVNDDNTIDNVNAQEFLNSELPYKHNNYATTELIQALFKKLQFNRQIELNGKLRELDQGEFEKKLALLVEAGLSVTKRGVKKSEN